MIRAFRKIGSLAICVQRCSTFRTFKTDVKWSNSNSRARVISLESSLALPRSLSTTALALKGHSKWQNIRHTKAAMDAKYMQLCSKYSHLIMVAIKENGMQKDPKLNKSLAKVRNNQTGVIHDSLSQIHRQNLFG